MANSVDPDQMLHSFASDLGLHCLMRPICLNTLGKYGSHSPQQIRRLFLFLFVHHRFMFSLELFDTHQSARTHNIHYDREIRNKNIY